MHMHLAVACATKKNRSTRGRHRPLILQLTGFRCLRSMAGMSACMQVLRFRNPSVGPIRASTRANRPYTHQVVQQGESRSLLRKYAITRSGASRSTWLAPPAFISMPCITTNASSSCTAIHSSTSSSVTKPEPTIRPRTCAIVSCQTPANAYPARIISTWPVASTSCRPAAHRSL
jgi:hypothetical protein